MPKRRLRRLKIAIGDRLSPKAFCNVVNRVNWLQKRAHVISLDKDASDGILIADDGTDRIRFCRRSRHTRYRRGVMAGIDRVAREYGIDCLSDLRDGTFIDCGANVGEFGLWANARGFRYIAFEPEELEAECVDLNAFGGQRLCHRSGLWNGNTTLTFHRRPDTADSSFLPSSVRKDGTTTLDVVRLDDAVNVAECAGPVILKVEAEGAEPEVLEGAQNSLPLVDWVAVDSGYERGPYKKHTFVETNTALVDHGFRLVAAQFGRVTALYRNTART